MCLKHLTCKVILMLEHINAWMLSPQLRIKSGAEASTHVISVSPTACPPSTHCLSASFKAQLNAYFSH